MTPDHLVHSRRLTKWQAPYASGSITATLRVPGSKSATARALVLSALADSPGSIISGLAARDTDLMIAGLRALGARIDDSNPDRWIVHPIASAPATVALDCGLAGTVMRFLPPLAALGSTLACFHGDEAASARPIRPLLDALGQLGVRVEGDALPFSVRGPIAGHQARIDSSLSSQFISALLLSAARFPSGLELTHVGGAIPSQPHIDMTVCALRTRGITVEHEENTWRVGPGLIHSLDEVIEPDLTTAAVFLAAGALTEGSVTLLDWPSSTTQPGALFLGVMERMGATVTRHVGSVSVGGTDQLHGLDIDLSPASELTPVVAALAATASTPSVIRGIGHIRGHETDRIAALAREITALGGLCRPTPDGLSITPATMRAGLFHTWGDHRMAHAGALIGLRVPGVSLDDVGCTSKTMPGFATAWEDMVR